MLESLMRFLGLGPSTNPPHVQDALDSAEVANQSIAEAKSAARSYWAGREDQSRALGDVARLEQRRAARRKRA